LKQRQERTSFLKKRSKKLFVTTAFERPQYGRSNAVGIKSFFGYFFFKKSNFFLFKGTES